MSKFAPGDIVRIKEWGEMADAYRTYENDIDLGDGKPWFTQPMRRFCGTVCTVTRIEMIGRYEIVRIDPLEEDDESIIFWNFCDEMLELVDTDTTEIPESDFDSLLEV